MSIPTQIIIPFGNVARLFKTLATRTLIGTFDRTLTTPEACTIMRARIELVRGAMYMSQMEVAIATDPFALGEILKFFAALNSGSLSQLAYCQKCWFQRPMSSVTQPDGLLAACNLK